MQQELEAWCVMHHHTDQSQDPKFQTLSLISQAWIPSCFLSHISHRSASSPMTLVQGLCVPAIHFPLAYAPYPVFPNPWRVLPSPLTSQEVSAGLLAQPIVWVLHINFDLSCFIQPPLSNPPKHLLLNTHSSFSWISVVP